MGYSVTVERVFSAAHAVNLPGLGREPIHGHDFRLRVTVERAELDANGFVVDFHELERNLEAVVGSWRNQNLNDFLQNPSAETICGEVARRLKIPPGVRLRCVEITEAPGCVARWEA